MMAVLISISVKGQTRQGYEALLSFVSPLIKKAPGFVMHCGHETEGAWQLYEIWESKAAADQWFGQYIVPSLPPGIHPKRSYQELHSLVLPAECTVM